MDGTEAVPTWREVAATGQLAKFVLLCLGVWLHAADSQLVATVMPAAVEEIGGVTLINWALVLYNLGSILAAVGIGALAGRIGLRAALLLTALLYAMGCGASAMAPSIGLLLVGRLLQGIGGGGMMALTYVAIHELFPERLWPRLLVVVSTIWGCSALCGPLIGGLFAEAGLWRGAFWAFAGQAGLVIAAARFLPEGRRDSGGGWAKLPLALLVAGTIGVASAGALAGADGSSAILLGLSGLALLYGFARTDARRQYRLLPADALNFATPTGSGLLMIFALAAATTPFGTYGPLLLDLLFGVGPVATGYLIALESIAWTLASIATSGAGARQEKRLIRLGAVLIALGAAGYALAVPGESLAGVVACLICQGAGFGMAWAYMVKQIVAAAPERERGAAAASVSSVQVIGYAVGASASGIAANAAGLGGAATADTGRTAALLLFAGFLPLALVGVGGALRLTRDPFR